jgi:hypothetical protein
MVAMPNSATPPVRIVEGMNPFGKYEPPGVVGVDVSLRLTPKLKLQVRYADSQNLVMAGRKFFDPCRDTEMVLMMLSRSWGGVSPK